MTHRIESRDEHNRMLLIFAESFDRADLVEMLLERGASIEAENSNGATALEVATSKGYVNTVKLLAAKEVHAKPDDGCLWTALFIAEHLGHMDIVKILKNAINASARDSKLERPGRPGRPSWF